MALGTEKTVKSRFSGFDISAIVHGSKVRGECVSLAPPWVLVGWCHGVVPSLRHS